ncbi:protein tyrosine phosphatase [Selenomonas sp. oral taxon 126]|uniref:low molecular weight protein-tyrosine-phosphatase n=1 Tax=Selenomonas sp. oral taxon 126 TaxID=712528 RepID=UPI00080780E2|nr:low molecular weight protein-tyrosine-phosphatase [Selenomonas sp. oral taxon 126]ANR70669.1 protein tyrosine phosphatase [Selenomonas sp. oral taxon 126]
MKHILFVCHGNICRSPMAEFVMKQLVREAGLSDEISVASKALHRDELGSDTHRGTREVLRAHGITFTKRSATLMTATDYSAYDCIIGMDTENMRDLMRLTGNDPQHKVRRLLSCIGEERDVADPWYTGNFDVTYRDVDAGCRALLRELTKNK